jgi:hypothetical protein
VGVVVTALRQCDDGIPPAFINQMVAVGLGEEHANVRKTPSWPRC